MYMSKKTIAAEFARRAKQFHPEENPMEINLWGLFAWGAISKYVKSGDIIPNKGFSKINEIIWCKPSQNFFDENIEPLLKEPIEKLTSMAGW